jgi:superfamily II DNA or RNA helicase
MSLEETSKSKNKNDIIYQDKLFPLLDDPLFSYRIGKKKEFYENGYIDYIEGKITERKFKERAELLCNLPFSLSPHQRFVKNFMSFSTPYNSLLLYHGLGTGKTCSAMGICEEMREYMKKVSSKQKIIIIASPNVQDNFKSQLFNKDRLKKIGGKWNLESCVGSHLIDEVTQNISQTIKKEVLIRSVNRLIKKYYMFIGYQEFSNFFHKKITKSLETVEIGEKQKEAIIQKRIQTFFGNRLIVVDEAHNLRPSNKKEKGVGNVLTQIVENTSNMRLLLLSATPMYNSPQEIIWLLNLMCKNDNIPTLDVKEVFDGKGNLKRIEDDDGNVIDIGAKKLAQKMSGHISFIRGENPFTFPFSLYPSEFERENSIKSLPSYPNKMMNGKNIIQPLEYLDCYMTDIGPRQKIVYAKILEELLKSIGGEQEGEKKLEDLEGFGYNFIQPLLDSLIISFPSIEDDSNSTITSSENQETETKTSRTFLKYTGKTGLENVVKFTKKSGFNIDYSYKKEIVEKYGRILSHENIDNYSGKFKSILDNIKNSEGIVLIYSQFLEGSLIPLAMSLEEEGYDRTTVANGFNLFSKEEQELINKKEGFQKRGKYAFISGNSGYSPNNAKELAELIKDDNKDGEKIKVVLISRAGSEGLDFKNIRQLHILEPWYNTKRIEQIIGRGVRNCSHKTLPFEKRNVSIYLHASKPFMGGNEDKEEPADLYVYRYAERGAVKIGIVSRIAKETSIDCLINNNMLDFDSEKLNLNVKIKLPNKRELQYQVGDKPYSSICDYMEKCSYMCKKGNYENYNKDDISEIGEMGKAENMSKSGRNDGELIDPSFYESDISNLITKISSLYLEGYVFSFNNIHERLKGYAGKPYSHLHIAAALSRMVENKNIKLIDNFGRYGYLVKIGNMYFFNPVEMTATPDDIFEIKTPVEYKHKKLMFKQPKKVKRKETKIVADKGERDDIMFLAEFINSIGEKIKLSFSNPEKTKNDKDWYHICGDVVPELMKHENMSSKNIEISIIKHFIDFDTTFETKKRLVEFLYSKDGKIEDENDDKKKLYDKLDSKGKTIMKIVEKYIDGAVVMKNKDTNTLLFGMFDNDFIFNYFVFSEENSLLLAKPEDINDFKITIVEFQKNIVDKLAEYVGFASVFKENRLIFKVKHMKQKRSKGARCDQAGKSSSISLIKDFRNEKIDGVENNSAVVKMLNKFKSSAVCVYQELLLRNYNELGVDDKVWFLPLEHYKQSNVEKITL